ncbi:MULTISPECIES: YhfC family glutamic-type intramembrane protease [Bacillus]|uniref:CAAX amino terminal protease family protein n=2 Tax=Bacillus cereus group TaxID=86661 RepID=A0A161R8V6_BACCE|nr:MULTISPECIES: YhfC family glutamic-type intramembrane protease [Bacillus]KZD73874.1 CAAX amino terminal protease family protein [Bacillus cereus]MDG1621513.1 YhfC family glutamic-type intramembrane protease [Bacillus mobilis]MDX5836017.1 YhfC family glutamic-type intramembrane protease [Bacillus cereus group sp. BfR-BA-01700]MED4384805.1 YhfC family glutamic-type intramembrane protease [Bacillus mobilis]OJE37148.1 CAAX protease [Bacillus mobilis]
MNGLIFTTMISFGLPLVALLYAFWKKRYIPYMLGVLAFVVSQILIRIPILNYVSGTSTNFQMFSVMQPVLFVLLLSLSAGIFEEIARFIAMRYFMKQRDWQSGFLFGAGHGGIEAVLIVGVPVISLLLSQTFIQNGDSYYFGGMERIVAMVLHIGLSIIVLQAVVQKKFRYVVYAILIHGTANAIASIISLYVPGKSGIIMSEVSIAICAVLVFSYSFILKRKGV